MKPSEIHSREVEELVKAALTESLRALNGNLTIDDIEHHVQDYLIRMKEPHRHYHGLDHVAYCLQLLRQVRGNLSCYATAEAAILLHDVIHDPLCSNNEQKSAEFAKQMYGQWHGDEIAGLIMATNHERPFERYGDDRDFIADIDLSILGVTWNEFVLYRSKIAEEYRGLVGDGAFKEGTLSFLRSMLNQSEEFLFRTSEFQPFEVPSIENLKNYIDMVATR